MLQSLLNSHPNAVCMHEILPETAGTPRFYRYNLGRRRRLIELRSKDIGRFLEAVLLEPQPRWVHAVGFKAHYVQPYDLELRRKTWTLLGAIDGLRVIWLNRNPVRSVVSFAIARQTGVWIGGRLTQPIRLEPEYLLRRLEYEDLEAAEARSRIEHQDIFEVSFEDIVTDPTAHLSDIQQFLGLPPHSLQVSLRRQNPRPISQLVSNYVEVEVALRGTRWYDQLLQEESILLAEVA